VRYVQLAHNHRKDGVTQAQVLLNLGREDKLDPDGLRRLVASINRYLGEPTAGEDFRTSPPSISPSPLGLRDRLGRRHAT
jgi:hypothetical protein